MNSDTTGLDWNIERSALCLITAKETIGIFDCHGEQMEIAEILRKHFHFLLRWIDGHSRTTFIAKYSWRGGENDLLGLLVENQGL